MLFTANRDGKQTDIYEFDRATRRARQLVATPEGEYSATITPDGKGISVIRVEADGTQRLWRFDRNGSNPKVVLSEIKPVGYHAWVDADRLVLFVLGKPSTLQTAPVSTGKGTVVASNVGRSILRMPGSNSISFVERLENGEHWVKELNPDDRREHAAGHGARRLDRAGLRVATGWYAPHVGRRTNRGLAARSGMA